MFTVFMDNDDEADHATWVKYTKVSNHMKASRASKRLELLDTRPSHFGVFCKSIELPPSPSSQRPPGNSIEKPNQTERSNGSTAKQRRARTARQGKDKTRTISTPRKKQLSGAQTRREHGLRGQHPMWVWTSSCDPPGSGPKAVYAV